MSGMERELANIGRYVRLWNPAPGGHHTIVEALASSLVAVPPMLLCIVIYIRNCDLSVLYHHLCISISVVAVINQYLKVSSL